MKHNFNIPFLFFKKTFLSLHPELVEGCANLWIPAPIRDIFHFASLMKNPQGERGDVDHRFYNDFCDETYLTYNACYVVESVRPEDSESRETGRRMSRMGVRNKVSYALSLPLLYL